MIDHIDFASVKVGKKQKCFKWKCNNSTADMQFYLTEWELTTGASTDGLIYCEKCVAKHLENIDRHSD